MPETEAAQGFDHIGLAATCLAVHEDATILIRHAEAGVRVVVGRAAATPLPIAAAATLQRFAYFVG
jgi:hypothetical protein